MRKGRILVILVLLTSITILSAYLMSGLLENVSLDFLGIQHTTESTTVTTTEEPTTEDLAAKQAAEEAARRELENQIGRAHV